MGLFYGNRSLGKKSASKNLKCKLMAAYRASLQRQYAEETTSCIQKRLFRLRHPPTVSRDTLIGRPTVGRIGNPIL